MLELNAICYLSKSATTEISDAFISSSEKKKKKKGIVTAFYFIMLKVSIQACTACRL